MALFAVSERFLPLQEQIEAILRKSAGRLNINNADERKSNQIPEKNRLKQP
jgi:type III restriction enzyme